MFQEMMDDGIVAYAMTELAKLTPAQIKKLIAETLRVYDPATGEKR